MNQRTEKVIRFWGLTTLISKLCKLRPREAGQGTDDTAQAVPLCQPPFQGLQTKLIFKTSL